MSDKPMTAEEICDQYRASREAGFVYNAVSSFVDNALDWMSAREREHAELVASCQQLGERVSELVARVERLEKGADDGR